MNGVETFRSTANQLLLRLPGHEWWRLRPLLRRENLPLISYLERAGSPPSKVYFVESGMISNLEKGDVRDPMEVCVIGREGMVGISTVGGLYPQRDSVVPIEGQALVLDRAKFMENLTSSVSLRPLLFRYIQAQMVQIRLAASPEVIRLVVLMYVRFPLSLRNVEDLLFERGIDIYHETVRLWWNTFGPMFAGEVRRKRVCRMRRSRHWRWHLDEMYVKLNGEMVYLWRAVDHEGEVLESYVTKTRDKHAALTFMKRALKRHGAPEAITTDGLRLYGAAMDQLGDREKQEIGRWANNRVENSHLPFRRRERAMLRFRQMKARQKFASVHASIHNHFSLERHLIDRQTYKERRSAALAEWHIIAN